MDRDKSSTAARSPLEDEAPAWPAARERRAAVPAGPARLDFPPFTARHSWNAKSVSRLLRGGEIVSDETFDEVFPDAVKHVSEVHWTPVEVAFRAARLLAPTRSARLLDIGAGAGKFCLIAAAATGADVRGVERSPYLASVAREAARRMGLAVDVRDGSFESEDPSTFDGVYLFNPFTESLCVPGVVGAFEHDERRSRSDIRRAEKFLRGVRVGARVATFCGFGGTMPPRYELMIREQRGGGILEIWTRTNAP
ncbi:MAG TPA: class I SAM-dependent methyltransferase [Labilithrix sp.]|nr:class I SAM-dependent methyltransferase [Labilithrix sp.]